MIKLSTPTLKHIGLSIVVILSPLFLFQNCSQFSNPQNDSDRNWSSTGVSEADPNHVPGDALALPSKQIRIANRRYMINLFNDIFTASDGTKATNLDSLSFEWLEKRGAQLGGACDTNDSLTRQDCNDDDASANLPIYGDSNAVRESFKIQMCEEMLGTELGLRIALQKLGLNIAQLPEPNFENLNLVYELFYRNDESPTYFLQTLSQLNSDLKAKGESNQNIWRGLLLLTCESPEWGLL